MGFAQIAVVAELVAGVQLRPGLDQLLQRQGQQREIGLFVQPPGVNAAAQAFRVLLLQ